MDSDDISIVNPNRYLEHAALASLLPSRRIPQIAVISYHPFLMQHVAGIADFTLNGLLDGSYVLQSSFGNIGVYSGFGIGAPATIVKLEELIAMGVQRVVIVGTAGSLSEKFALGDFVVCTGAVPGEGTSRYYGATGDIIAPAGRLTSEIQERLRVKGIDIFGGVSWSTDAPYRETKRLVKAAISKGAEMVEMEASAVFAVAQFRGIEAAAVFVISDLLHNFEWNCQLHNNHPNDRLVDLFDKLFLDSISCNNERGKHV
ncbi:MAG TPA: nucleoside phosphorylase [Candidatus Baltobacteraceae bacterium]|jgi:uridine phosphorylase|nr:nucleoside phosphorylase [Candidatus Baltobacteraceae bacterium]